MVNTTRVNYMCPDDLLERIDARAKELNINRTAYINMALSQHLQQEEMIRNLPVMLDTFNKAIDESKRIHK